MADANGVVILTAYDEFDGGFPLASGSTVIPTSDDSKMRIVFLGTPALGKDSVDDDRNKIVDDFMQCVIAQGSTAADEFDDGDLDPDGNESNCQGWHESGRI